MSNKNSADHISVGYIRAAHGVRGEVFAHIPSGEWPWAEVGRSIGLRKREDAGEILFLTVEAFKPHKTGLILRLEAVVDRNQAEDLKGSVLYIEKEFFVSDPGEKIFLNEVLGFVVLSEGCEIGEVTGFMETGAHDILRVKNQNHKEHLIPFVENFIEEIDFDGRRILMSLPEGLVE